MFNIYFTVYISKSQLQPDEIIQYNQQKFIVMRVIRTVRVTLYDKPCRDVVGWLVLAAG